MALVDASISLSGRVDLHLRLDAMLATPELADVQISVAVQLPAVLVPHNIGPWLSLSHAEEDDLMSKDVFIVKVGSLRYLGSLLTGIPLSCLIILPIFCVGSSNLTICSIPARPTSDT